jgi:hypothetical protein
VLDQKHEQVHGVTFKPYCLPATAQLVGPDIKLEIAKADNWMRIRLRHSWYFGCARKFSHVCRYRKTPGLLQLLSMVTVTRGMAPWLCDRPSIGEATEIEGDKS